MDAIYKIAHLNVRLHCRANYPKNSDLRLSTKKIHLLVQYRDNMTWCQFYLDRMGQKLYKYFSNDKLCFLFCKQYTEHMPPFFFLVFSCYCYCTYNVCFENYYDEKSENLFLQYELRVCHAGQTSPMYLEGLNCKENLYASFLQFPFFRRRMHIKKSLN